jgi:hypothetical protein
MTLKVGFLLILKISIKGGDKRVKSSGFYLIPFTLLPGEKRGKRTISVL